jgi:hypothetical protein
MKEWSSFILFRKGYRSNWELWHCTPGYGVMHFTGILFCDQVYQLNNYASNPSTSTPNIKFDTVQCLKLKYVWLHGNSGLGYSPVFRWLVVTILTEFYYFNILVAKVGISPGTIYYHTIIELRVYGHEQSQYNTGFSINNDHRHLQNYNPCHIQN